MKGTNDIERIIEKIDYLTEGMKLIAKVISDSDERLERIEIALLAAAGEREVKDFEGEHTTPGPTYDHP